jgi:hypothetical protein
MKRETSECKHFQRTLHFEHDIQAKQVIITYNNQSLDRAQKLHLSNTSNR